MASVEKRYFSKFIAKTSNIWNYLFWGCENASWLSSFWYFRWWESATIQFNSLEVAFKLKNCSTLKYRSNLDWKGFIDITRPHLTFSVLSDFARKRNLYITKNPLLSVSSAFVLIFWQRKNMETGFSSIPRLNFRNLSLQAEQKSWNISGLTLVRW